MKRNPIISVILMKSLNYFSSKKVSNQGFVLPMVIGLGLIMTVAGLTMVVRSSDNEVGAELTEQEARAKSAAEAGVSRFSSYLSNPQNVGLLQVPYDYTEDFNIVWEPLDEYDGGTIEGADNPNVCIQAYLERLAQENEQNTPPSARIDLFAELDNNTRYDIVRYTPPDDAVFDPSAGANGNGTLVVLGRYHPDDNYQFQGLSQNNRLTDLPNETATSLIEVDIPVNGANMTQAEFEAPFPIGYFSGSYNIDTTSLEIPDGSPLSPNEVGLMCGDCEDADYEPDSFDLENHCVLQPDSEENIGTLTDTAESNFYNGSSSGTSTGMDTMLGDVTLPEVPEVNDNPDSENNFSEEGAEYFNNNDLLQSSHETVTEDGETQYHYRISPAQLEYLDSMSISSDFNPDDENAAIYFHVDQEVQNQAMNIDNTTDSNFDNVDEVNFIFDREGSGDYNIDSNRDINITSNENTPVNFHFRNSVNHRSGDFNHNGDFGDFRIFGNPEGGDAQALQLRGTPQSSVFVHAPEADVWVNGGSRLQGVIWANNWDGNSSGTNGTLAAPYNGSDGPTVDELWNAVGDIYAGSTDITLSIDAPNMEGNSNWQTGSIEQHN